jgi:hypothetical protein
VFQSKTQAIWLERRIIHDIPRYPNLTNNCIMCLQACHASNCSPGQRRSLQGYAIGRPAKRQLEAPVPKLRHCQVLPTAIDGKKRQVQLVPFPFYIHRSFQPSLVFVLALGNLLQPERAPDLHNMPYSQVIRRTQLQISRR